MRTELLPAPGAGKGNAVRTVAQYAVGSSTAVEKINALAGGLLRHWLLIVSVVLGIFVGLPWLAPLFMRLGLETPGRLIYLLYSPFCHQLPERSWFLFGHSFTYPLAEFERLTGGSADFFALRRYVGNPEMGWKVAWSDRMVSFYGGWLLFAVLYGVVRRLRPGWRGLRWQAAAFLLLPMALDGMTHAVSDLAGVGLGFRDSNSWLAAITGNMLPAAFYAGDAWGSFNSLARLGTGLLAAAGLMLWLLPWIDRLMREDGAHTAAAPMRPGIPGKAGHPHDNASNIAKGRSVTMAQDPVCGMDVDEKTAAGKSEYQGQTYYFCSTGCKASFDKDPQKYAGKGQTSGARH